MTRGSRVFHMWLGSVMAAVCLMAGVSIWLTLLNLAFGAFWAVDLLLEPWLPLYKKKKV